MMSNGKRDIREGMLLDFSIKKLTIENDSREETTDIIFKGSKVTDVTWQ